MVGIILHFLRYHVSPLGLAYFWQKRGCEGALGSLKSRGVITKTLKASVAHGSERSLHGRSTVHPPKSVFAAKLVYIAPITVMGILCLFQTRLHKLDPDPNILGDL